MQSKRGLPPHTSRSTLPHARQIPQPLAGLSHSGRYSIARLTRIGRAPDDPRLYTMFWGPCILAAVTDAPERLRIPAAETLALASAGAHDPARVSAPLVFHHDPTGTAFIPYARIDRKPNQLYHLDAERRVNEQVPRTGGSAKLLG